MNRRCAAAGERGARGLAAQAGWLGPASRGQLGDPDNEKSKKAGEFVL